MQRLIFRLLILNQLATFESEGSEISEDLIVTLSINRTPCAQECIVKKIKETYFIQKRDLFICGAKTDQIDDQASSIAVGDADYVDVRLISKSPPQLEMRELVLSLFLKEEYLTTQKLAVEHIPSSTSKYPFTGGFLNYDIGVYNTDHVTLFNALPEIVLFSDVGYLSSSMFYQTDKKPVRLDTVVVKEFPTHLTQLRLGDSIVRPTSFTGAARFTGLQYGRNFSASPGFITYPMPVVNQSAAVPTTIDVLINNAKVYTNEIKAGPYQLENIPLVTGSGEMLLQTSDLLGNQQTEVFSYYVSRKSLKEGLSDFSFAVGKLRANYGSISNDYLNNFATAYYLYGLTNEWTVGANAQLANRLKLGGIETLYTISPIGVFSGGIAYSSSPHHKGNSLFSLGFERQASPFSFSLSGTYTSGKFQDLAFLPDTFQQRFNWQSIVSYNDASLGTFSITHVETRDGLIQNRSNLTVLSYQKSFSNRMFITANIGQLKALKKSNFFYFSLNFALDEGKSTGITQNKSSDSYSTSLYYQKNLMGEYGTAYRGEVIQGKTTDGRFDFQNRNKFSDIQGRVLKSQDQVYYQGSASGSLVMTDQKIIAAPKIYDSFAIVTVPETPNLTIRKDGIDFGETDEDGELIVPNLKTFSEARFYFNPEELEMNRFAKSDEERIFPQTRGGYKVIFDVDFQTPQSFQITTETGTTFPPGTMVTIGDLVTYVGFDSYIYLENYPQVTQGTIYHEGYNYDFSLPEENTSQKIICRAIPSSEHN